MKRWIVWREGYLGSWSLAHLGSETWRSSSLCGLEIPLSAKTEAQAGGTFTHCAKCKQLEHAGEPQADSPQESTSALSLEQAVTKALFAIQETAALLRSINERSGGRYAEQLGRLYLADAELRASLEAKTEAERNAIESALALAAEITREPSTTRWLDEIAKMVRAEMKQ